jgi:hypothetical protein
MFNPRLKGLNIIFFLNKDYQEIDRFRTHIVIEIRNDRYIVYASRYIILHGSHACIVKPLSNELLFFYVIKFWEISVKQVCIFLLKTSPVR